MSDKDLLDKLEVDLALIKAQWFLLGTAIHHRSWAEVGEVFRRMGARLGESAETIDWSLDEGGEA
ncbi:MAG: hypothetical protein HY985_15385 [Magnetospirillum sp.]|nr:hypothetical protein [Magnetospirillum sp.]